jgi:hypothetical protein
VKVAKHVLILLGLAGVLGVIMPLAEVRKGIAAVQLSAKDLSFGLEKTHAALDRKLPKLVEKRLGSTVIDTRDELRMVADGLKYAALLFAPAALLVLIGIIAVLRKRLGRVLAATALLIGLVSLASWIGLHYGIDYALEEADVKGMTIELMAGAHMLIVGAIAGMGVGLAALIKPEPLPGAIASRPPSPSPQPPPSAPPSSMPPPSVPPPGGPRSAI